MKNTVKKWSLDAFDYLKQKFGYSIYGEDTLADSLSKEDYETPREVLRDSLGLEGAVEQKPYKKESKNTGSLKSFSKGLVFSSTLLFSLMNPLYIENSSGNLDSSEKFPNYSAIDFSEELNRDYADYFSLENRVKGESAEEIQKLKQEYGGKVAEDSYGLIEKGLIDRPEELAYIARAVYFESAFHEKKMSNEDLRKSMSATAHVMMNRYQTDSARIENGEEPIFSSPDRQDVYGVLTRKSKNQYGNFTNQFTCVDWHEKYFSDNLQDSFMRIYDVGQNGKKKVNVGVGFMNEDLVQMAYKETVDALYGKSEDPTKNSRHYLDISSASSHVVWYKKKKKVEDLVDHTYFKNN